MSKFRGISLMLTLVAALLAGCGDDTPTQQPQQQTQDAAKAQDTTGIGRTTEQQKLQADQAVKQAYAQVEPNLTTTAPADDAKRQFALDLAVLTRNTHRLAGREDGSLAASRFVEDRLRSMGIEQVQVQTFPVVLPEYSESTLTVDGKTVDIEPLRPNVVQASITPAQGLTGPTQYVGKGELSQYGSRLPDGGIVVIDFDCQKEWLNAFAWGAKAIIFVSDDGRAVGAYQHVNVPANLPRFYMSRTQAAELGLLEGSKTVTLKAACEWKQSRGRNVIALLRGTEPSFSPDRPPQAIVLAAPLDTYGQVPDLSPGARDAANIALMLQTAAYLKDNRPKRDVILCFFDAQTQCHQGARAFYGALYRRIANAEYADMTLEDRIESLQSERQYIERVLARYASDNIFAPGDDLTPAMQLLQREVRNIGSDVLDELRPLREERRDRQSRIKRLQETQADAAQIAAAQEALDKIDAQVNTLTLEDLAWNTVERAVFEQGDLKDPKYAARLLEKINDEDQREQLRTLVPQRLDDLLRRTIAVYRGRIGEIDQSIVEARQGLSLRNEIGPSRNAIVLHISHNLGDARRNWTFVHGEDSVPMGEDSSGIYSSIFLGMREVHQQSPQEYSLFDDRPVGTLYESRLFAPGLVADSGGIARIFALYNVALFTSMDDLPRQGLPADTVGNLDGETMLAQARQAMPFVAALASSPKLNVTSSNRVQVTYAEGQFAGPNRNNGPSVKRMGGGSAMPDQPVRGALVAMMRPKLGAAWGAAEVSKQPPGFNYPYITMTNVNGVFEVGPYSNSSVNYYRPALFAATFDRPSVLGQINNQEYLSRGLIASATSMGTLLLPTGTKMSNFSVQLFNCRSKTLVGWGYDRGSIPSKALRALSTSAFREDAHLLVEHLNVITLFAPYDAQGFKLHNKTGPWILNNELTRQGYEGSGMSLDDQFDHPVTARWTAHDLQVLNQFRLDMLRAVRISQESLEVLNSVARDLFEDATGMTLSSDEANLKPDASAQKYLADMEASAAYSRRTYPPLISTMNDLVTAVVLLLLLAMPFAFALERLIIGTPHIYRQIGWFATFFIITFGVLFFVNPAFRIAATPMIIFLAFTIILLSSLVIFIMVRKLQSEIKKMQGLATTVHSADVSRLSTMMAAVNMGISTMRRRPVRTVLTAATVVLLTFTILTFASFGSRWGIRQRFEAPMSGSASRALLRHQLWNPIDQGTFEVLRGHFGDEATVVGRYWVSPTAADVTNKEAREIMLTSGNMEHESPVAAVIGMDGRDLTAQPELASLFEGDHELLESDGIFLTESVARQLALKTDDIGKTKVILGGRLFTFAGTITDRASTFGMLEGSSLLPVDYEASVGQQAQQSNTTQARSEMPDVESAQFVRYNVDRIVMIGAAQAREMNGQLRSVTLYPANPENVRDIADRAAIISELPVYVGQQGGVYRLIFASLAEASGWKDLLIPVVLGGLIIFATMLGSVSDREREIYTFSSLGLAPPHVASLFFAEASIYAVVGGMGGYLLGQAVARLLGWLSGMGLVPVIPMNYSSTNAIVTVLIVMCTVLISTIYPAVKASRSANPGIQRAWKIPKPQGNLYDLTFPFTVSAYDIIGVVSFLKEHFDNFSDVSLGAFATMESGIFRQNNDMLGFRAQVALAPFDLGVTQKFALLSQPSEIQGIDEVRIMIYRLSGAAGDWQRSNRVFINDLRKQLLIWRSLPHEVMDKYRQRTLEQWDSLPVESVDGQSIGGMA